MVFSFLTARQRAVVRGVLQSKRDYDIADNLKVSLRTIETEQLRLRQATGSRDRVELLLKLLMQFENGRAAIKQVLCAIENVDGDAASCGACGTAIPPGEQFCCLHGAHNDVVRA